MSATTPPGFPETPREFLANWTASRGNLRNFLENQALAPLDEESQRTAGEAAGNDASPHRSLYALAVENGAARPNAPLLGVPVPQARAEKRSALVRIDVATGERHTLLDRDGTEVDPGPVSPDGTRVLVPATHAWRTDYRGVLSQVPVPQPGGDLGDTDVSRPAASHFAADYFFEVEDQVGRIVTAFEPDGRGFAQTSTAALRGRKLFLWGRGPGGRARDRPPHRAHHLPHRRRAG